MIIEVTAWAPTRATAEAFMSAVGITDAEGNPIVDVQIDHIGDIEIAPAVLDESFEVVTPAVTVGGHHVNVRYYGDSARALIEGMPTEGDLFERTRILDMVDARTGIQLQWEITRHPVPPGYEFNGIRLFDPALIGSRSRVWA
ncbi:MAG: hypothetical protein ACRCV5_24020 [Afipia sp.]